MRQMHISHDPVVITQARHADILSSTQVEGAEFAYGVVVADFQPCRFIRIFLVLRYFTQRTKLKNTIVSADARMPVDHHMGTYHRPWTYLDMLTDDRIRTH